MLAIISTPDCLPVDRMGQKARDLAMAAQVQRSILPPERPRLEGVDAAWHYQPTTEVGGDLLDVIPLPGGRSFFFLADAMGHGVQAALVAATVKATLTAHLHEVDDLTLLLSRLDDSLENFFEDRYVTAAACVVDPAAMTLRYAIAGHPPILLCGPDGVIALMAGGLPLGTALGVGVRGGEVALTDGSALLLFSDGLIEAEGHGRCQFGLDTLVERFLDLADEPASAIVAGLRAALDLHCGPINLKDDLTIVAARITQRPNHAG